LFGHETKRILLARMECAPTPIVRLFGVGTKCILLARRE
jgi:hypothetical protein